MKITSKQLTETLKYLRPKPLIKFNLIERSAFSDIRFRNYELSGLAEPVNDFETLVMFN